ncbi:MAG: DUF4388 domain-containing protein [Candidatus Sumerlaeaceae bacterium]|nr:DUF4388 domain-containing protein [Candidatus Sumerlaeaceae bacterium]
MELEGRLNPALSIPEVLQFLSMGKMTGTLTIVHGENQVSLVLKGGRLVNSSSLNRPHRLGQLLASRGVVERSVVEEAVATQQDQDSPEMLGRMLIQRGAITPEQLRSAMRLQLEEELWELFRITEGTFKFERIDNLIIRDVAVELDIGPLLIEGTRRLDEWTRIIKNVPSDLCVPVVRPMEDRSEREVMPFSENEWRVLSLINGFFNVGSIASRSGVGRFETYRILNSFLASGLVVIKPEERATRRALEDVPLSKPPANGAKPKTDTVGSSSARLMAVFFKSRDAEAEAQARQEERTILEFRNPVEFVAALANSITEKLLGNPEFYKGELDERIAEFHWNNILMSYPKADLVTAVGRRIETARFNRFVEEAGIDGPFKACYEDTLEALNHHLRTIFLMAAQRLGTREAEAAFKQYFDNFRQRSKIGNDDQFFFKDFAGKVYA